MSERKNREIRKTEEPQQQVETQVVEFLTGLRSKILATVWKQIRDARKPLTYGNTLDELKNLKVEWEADSSDQSQGKQLYLAIIDEEVAKIEAKLAS